MPPDNEKVIESILRKYGGVFSDYIYIDEKDIAARTNLSQNTVYNILKALGQQHIAHYIPRKSTPYITFKTRRVDTHEIVLTPEIYEERKQEYRERINAMINYITNTHICRSRILLNYFGEEDIHDCRQCDICHTRHQDKDLNKRIEQAATAIINMVSLQPHPLQDIYNLPFESHVIAEAVQWLLNDDEIDCTDSLIKLKDS
jgi:ATP-dependent DNA helicase RecQ